MNCADIIDFIVFQQLAWKEADSCLGAFRDYRDRRARQWTWQQPACSHLAFSARMRCLSLPMKRSQMSWVAELMSFTKFRVLWLPPDFECVGSCLDKTLRVQSLFLSLSTRWNILTCWSRILLEAAWYLEGAPALRWHMFKSWFQYLNSCGTLAKLLKLFTSQFNWQSCLKQITNQVCSVGVRHGGGTRSLFKVAFSLCHLPAFPALFAVVPKKGGWGDVSEPCWFHYWRKKSTKREFFRGGQKHDFLCKTVLYDSVL